jgi:hypothetical protein
MKLNNNKSQARRNTVMGSTAPKRYNDENVNYGNRMQANGNRYGLEGQLGCSKVEIDKKRKLAAM